MSSGEESREEELTIVNLENVKRISETFKPRRGAGKDKRGLITKCMVKEVWKDRLSPRFYSRLMSVMFPEESNEVSFLSFYTIYKNLAEPDTEVMFRALTIYHIATIHEPPFNYEQANEYPNASYKAIKDYVCDVITSYLHAIIQFNMKEACAWLDLRASNTLIDGNLVASYMLKDLETHRNEVSIGSLEIWLEKNEMYYTVSEQLYLYLFGVKTYCEVKPLLPFPVIQTGRATKTLLALPDVLLLNSKLPRRSQRWTLAYMLDSRSQNWESLKNAIYGKSQTIIVIQDANGDIFGMYGSQKWFPCKGFFGNNECFLFTLKPDVNIYEGSGRDNNFQLFSESGIGMGGTADCVGLFIQCNVQCGSTSLACSTFREFWPLARELTFKICEIEIWEVEYECAESPEQELVKRTSHALNGGEMCESEAMVCTTQKHDSPKTTTCCSPGPLVASSSAQCNGKCASRTGSRKQPNYCPGKVCCSKFCAEKCNRSNHERDTNDKFSSAQQYPRLEEEQLQCQHRYSEDKMRFKNGMKHLRVSNNVYQASAGFTHPSLAAEENTRNAKAAPSENSRKEIAVEEKNTTKERTHNKPKVLTSRKPDAAHPPKINLPLKECESSQKSKLETLKQNTQTQVGESKLTIPKCACVIKQPCNSPPKVSPLTLGKIGQEDCNAIKQTRSCQDNERGRNNNLKSDVTGKGSNGIKGSQSNPVNGMSAESSSTVVIDTIDTLSNPNFAEVPASGYASSPKSTRPTGNPPEVLRTDGQCPAQEKKVSHLNSTSQNMTEANCEQAPRKIKPAQEDQPYSVNGGDVSIYTRTSPEAKEDLIEEYLKQAEINCDCSESSDCTDGEETENPESDCHCELKLNNELTKTNQNVPLDEMSSSMCSCILDNKNRVLTSVAKTSVTPIKETQNHIQSKVKSDESRIQHSPRTLEQPEDCENIKKKQGCKQNSIKPTTHCLARKEREESSSTVLCKNGRLSVPSTCMKCGSLLGQQGCRCDAKLLIHQTYYVEGKPINEDPSDLHVTSSQSVFKEEGPALDSKTKVNEGSAEPNQGRKAPKESCKSSCKCSLSPSYFPAFPEDLIKEGGTIDDCDCGSYTCLPFPIVDETPVDLSASSKSLVRRISPETDAKQQERSKQDMENAKCGCEDSDNTIVILNVSKCNTSDTVEKIIQELDAKAGDMRTPNGKSLIFRCNDLPSPIQYTKGTAKREALKRHIEKILKPDNHSQLESEKNGEPTR